MINIKSPEELARMRVSGRIAAIVRDRIARIICPGITTREVDEHARCLIVELGGDSAFRGYRGYPGHICLSINEEVVHGVPGPRRIELGDIVSIDVGVRYDGYIGDTASTVMVGVTDPAVIRLVEGTKGALAAGIAMARSGQRVSDISYAIENYTRSLGFSVVHEFVGHGIGRDMHEEPQIPNFGRPGQGPKLKVGMTLAIEPMVNLGCSEVDVMKDGWTVLTRDRKPSAHFEHTVVVQEHVAEILTLGEDAGSDRILIDKRRCG